MKPRILLTALLAAALAGPACRREPAGSAAAPPPAAQASPALAAVFAAAAPADAASIHATLPAAKPGDSVVVHGRVLGALEPFVNNRAAFILGDPDKLTACSDIPGDECPTPWDACCDAPELKRTSIATIQVVDGNGAVLREALKGVNGLRELSRVTVAGVVAPGSGDGVLVINAVKIHVAGAAAPAARGS
jgi:hypothetical protein